MILLIMTGIMTVSCKGSCLSEWMEEKKRPALVLTVS